MAEPDGGPATDRPDQRERAERKAKLRESIARAAAGGARRPRKAGRAAARFSERDCLALAVASLRCEGLLQEEIAAHLGISQPETSRLLQRAKKRKWLISRIDRQALPEGLWVASRRRYFSFDPLRKKLAELSRYGDKFRLEVVFEPEEDFSIGAARELARLLDRSEMIGAIWGRTLADVVTHLRKFYESSKPRRRPKRKVIPLCGEPLHLSNKEADARYSSSRLAAALREIVNGGKDIDPPYLWGVPAYLSKSSFPPDRADQEWEVVRRFIHAIPGYRRIFLEGRRGEPPQADQVDMLLTAVGVIVTKSGGRVDLDQTGAFIKERIEQEPGVTIEELREWIYGDIGGILVPREDLSDEKQRRVRAMNEGWVGVSAERLRRCAERAVEQDRPGVVVIAEACEKAIVVKAGVEAGLVTTAIISSRLARTLNRLLQIDSS